MLVMAADIIQLLLNKILKKGEKNMDNSLNADKIYLEKTIQVEREKYQVFAEALKNITEGTAKEIIKTEQSARMFKIRLLEQFYQKNFM